MQQKFTSLKEEYENKTKELFDQLDDLKDQMKELDDSEDSYDDEQDSDSVHESELGDTLDVNEITRDVHFDRESDETPKDRTMSGGDGKAGSESGEDDPESGGKASKENEKSQEALKALSKEAESKKSGNLPKASGGFENEPKTPRRMTKDQRSMADQSQSDVHSSHRSRRSKRFKLKRGIESQSKMDISSQNSGFMSRTNKRSIRRGDGKRSVSMAIKNETLINKI